jgi:hypothetical protein
LKRTKKNLICGLLVATLTLPALASPVAVSAYNGIDPMIPLDAPVTACMSDLEMDCIESIVIFHPDGTNEKAELVSDESNIWSYHDLKLDGAVLELRPHASIWTRTFVYPGEFQPRPVLDVEGDSQNINPLEKIQFTLRMSWLRPQDVALHAKDAFFKAEPITGGTKYIFGGSTYLAGLVNDWAAWNAVMDTEEVKADYDQKTLYFRITDFNTIPNSSAFSDTCSDQGYTVTSNNAITAGMPHMKDKDTLDFTIWATHFLADGSLTQGFFQADIHTAYLDCQFPDNTLTKSSNMTIDVVDQKGSKEVATTSVSVTDGILHIRAYGFHYSAPTIRVKAGAAPIAKKVAITCVKGKLTKKVTAVKPVCPKGYKKIIVITCVKGKLTKKVSAVNPACPKGYRKK